jgi:hypothetical protein
MVFENVSIGQRFPAAIEEGRALYKRARLSIVARYSVAPADDKRLVARRAFLPSLRTLE